ncbi:signal peptidase I [Leptolyngbya sp. FACHB-261]|uniref:signal peptidase I n=1 Tax=Leptolyngbya sp. FACHB-261 TaxID=2692806 RepID=UPI001689EE84|nr:signal peptidase I [Leptolyngbya sp. FACHB-261]MBD2099366.1 signal peptidase I [Leptolyngbya sp. FACHB-261]
MLKWLRGQKDNLQTILIALLLAILIRTFVAEARYIPSASMEPTLQINDKLIVEKVSYRFRPPQPGEIVVFYPPDEPNKLPGEAVHQAFIKRVIGTPGDELAIHDGEVYVNQKPLAEPYIAAPPTYEWGPEQIPSGNFFVMGDNRNNSNDSHVWGFLPADRVIGRAWVRFWPVKRASLLATPTYSNSSPVTRSPVPTLEPEPI